MFIDILQKVTNLRNINTEYKNSCILLFPCFESIIPSYFTDFGTVYLCHFKQGHALQEYSIIYVSTNWHDN